MVHALLLRRAQGGVHVRRAPVERRTDFDVSDDARVLYVLSRLVERDVATDSNRVRERRVEVCVRVRGGGRGGVHDGVHGEFDDLWISVLFVRGSAHGVHARIGVLWDLLFGVVSHVFARGRREVDADVAGVLGSDGKRHGGVVSVGFRARLFAHSVQHAHQRVNRCFKTRLYYNTFI